MVFADEIPLSVAESSPRTANGPFTHPQLAIYTEEKPSPSQPSYQHDLSHRNSFDKGSGSPPPQAVCRSVSMRRRWLESDASIPSAPSVSAPSRPAPFNPPRLLRRQNASSNLFSCQTVRLAVDTNLVSEICTDEESPSRFEIYLCRKSTQKKLAVESSDKLQVPLCDPCEVGSRTAEDDEKCEKRKHESCSVSSPRVFKKTRADLVDNVGAPASTDAVCV
eukprot:GILJ01003859.1.p1 GENE.GILJ01003859.1~~GILJ01003859.1.p1  ORF type:complete len:221 (+),score=26.09 GILJ01003859.1:45-707(+)